MLKWIVPVTKKEGVDRDTFHEFWRCIHAPHVANLAKPVRYTVTLFDGHGSLGGPPPTSEMPYDGVAELWFRDFEHFNEAFAEHRGALRTIDGFSDLIEPTTDGLFTTENIIVDSEPSPARLQVGGLRQEGQRCDPRAVVHCLERRSLPTSRQYDRASRRPLPPIHHIARQPWR